MSRPPCEHGSCALPATLGVRDVELVETTGPTGRTRVSVRYAGRQIGSMQDDGFQAHPSHGGEWVPLWDTFAGGSNVLSHGPDKAAALAHLVDYCSRAAFHMRMALHP